MKLKIGLFVIISFFGLVLFSFSSGKKMKAQITTLIIVRHAEKNNETDTSTLSSAGTERSLKLAQLLVNTELAAIYATPFIRTHHTAKPTADQHYLKIQDYKPHEMSEIENIVLVNYGQIILIVGHSNTIPSIVNYYKGTSFENLSSYNDVFVLSISNSKLSSNSLVHFYY